jgi:drug/metabolite transporter (DMT)-like permease
MDLIYMTSYQMLLGGLALLAIGASQSGLLPFNITLKSAAMLVYLAFLSAAAFTLWNSVMKYNRVGKVSIYLFLMPISGVLLSAVILGETIHLAILLALALVGAGVVIINRDDSSKSRHGQAAAAGSESAVK